MKLKSLAVIFTLFCTTINAQIISQFSWDSNPVTTANIGPNAIGASTSATSDLGGVSGTNGLNAGLPKLDLDFIIPTTGGMFDVAGIDVSFDYQRDESSGTFFQRGNSLIINGASNLSVTYRVNDGAGGFNTISSGNVYAIPHDDVFRNYRFYYLPTTGYGALLVNGVEVWSNDGADNGRMYWVGAGNIVIGDNMDGSGSNKTFLDNLTIGSVTTNPLPIELVDFTVKKIEEHALLEWQTASEINNDYFTIERSIDARNWEELQTVDGAGNSNSLLNYKAIDNNPYSGLSYYRLKQTDFDGKFSYSEIRSLNMIELNNSNIYPNPTTDKITIESNEIDLAQLKIFNLLGQDVTPLTPINNNGLNLIVDLSNLDAGIYFVSINSNTTKVYKK